MSEEPKPSPDEPGPGSRGLWRIAKIALGVILVPVGIVGLFIPVLQGVVLLLVAMALLAGEIPAVARLRERARQRYPKPFEAAERLKNKLKDSFR